MTRSKPSKKPTDLKNVKPSASRERAARAAVLISNVLKRAFLGLSPKRLEELVLKEYPEWKELSQKTAGQFSTQSKLTNDIAWGKNALKDGGYTISKKEAAQGGKEILKLTEKGRQASLEKEPYLSWEQHFVLISQGKAA
jgi:hypothetical protein